MKKEFSDLNGTLSRRARFFLGWMLLAGATLLAGCGNDDEMVHVSGIALDKSSLELVVGHSETLHATVSPDEATNPELRWASNNSTVARVDSYGRVSAFTAGTASISVRSVQDASKMAICTLTVLDAPAREKDPKGNDNLTKPAIHGFSPTRAGFDAELTLQGENFSAVLEENTVTLNGIPATVVEASKTELKVLVPKDKGSTGLIEVTVNGETASIGTFTYVLTPVVSHFAGTGVAGFGGVMLGSESEGKSAFLNAQFRSPRGVAIDSMGNVYVADTGNHSIRKITAQGVLIASTLAGNGSSGTADGKEEAARFNSPWDIITSANGDLYVADSGNGSLRTVLPNGSVSTHKATWPVSVPSHPLGFPAGITRNANDGSFYVTDSNNHRILKLLSDGDLSVLAGDSSTSGYHNANGTSARFHSPRGIVRNPKTGDLYVADNGNHSIRKVTQQGDVSTFAGNGTSGSADGKGDAARFNSPQGITIDAEGNFYVTESCRIRKISPAGEVSTLAGHSGCGYENGIGTVAQFSGLAGIAIHPTTSDLYVTDTNNHRIRRIRFE